MNPERRKVAETRFKFMDKTPTLLYRQGEFNSPTDANKWHFYARGFEDGVEHILETSKSLKSLENSLTVKDIRMGILEKENNNLKMRLEHRKKLQDETLAELKIVIDMLTVTLGLKDPKLIKRMNEIRDRLDIK
jgi:hypothetical protein